MNFNSEKMELTKKQSLPFDIYDFFGYLFPGFVMLVYLIVFLYLVIGNPFEQQYICNENSFFQKDHYEILFTILFLVVFTMTIYIIGHFVATVGSFWLDRIFLYGNFDSPFYFLLDIENKNRSIYLQFTYRYLFVLFYLFISLSIFSSNLIFLFLSILFLSAILLIFLMRILYEFDTFKKFYDVCKKFEILKVLIDGFIGIFVEKIFHLIRILVNNNKPLSKDVIKSFEQEFIIRFGKSTHNIYDDCIWLSYFYISSRNLEHTASIRTWHQLYGFSRNIACASYISSLLCSLYLLITNLLHWLYPYVYKHNDNVTYVIFLLVFSLIIGTIFYFRYFNLNQSYYTKNIIHSFITLSKNSEK